MTFQPVKALGGFLSKYIYISELGVKPEEYAKKAYTILAATAGFTAFMAFFSIFMLKIPMMAVVGLIPLVGGLYITFRPVIKAKSFESQCEREAPYVAALLTSYAAVGVPPHVSLRTIPDKRDLFPAFTKLVKRIERVQQLLVRDVLEAIEYEADKLDNLALKDLLQAAVGAERGGGGMFTVLKDKMRSLFNDLREKYKGLGDQMKVIGDILLVFFGVLPLLMYTMLAVFASAQAVETSTMFTYLVTPMLLFALGMLIDTAYPKTPQSFDKYYKQMLIFLPGAAIVGASFFMFPEILKMLGLGDLLTYKTAIAIALASIILFSFSAMFFLKDYRFMMQVEFAVPSFARDLTEEIKKGKAPSQAVIFLSQTRNYNKAFNALLTKISAQLQVGHKIKDAVKPIKQTISWRSAVILDLIADAEEAGAQREIFEEITEVSREIRDAVNIAKKKTTGIKFFGFMVAALMIGISALLIKQIVVPLSQMATTLPQEFIIGQVRILRPEQLPILVDNIAAGIMINSASLGLLIGKMTEGVLASGFLYAALYTLIALVSMLFLL